MKGMKMSIKKIVNGVILSDGSLDRRSNRFMFYNVSEEYIDYMIDVLSTIKNIGVTKKTVYKNNKVVGYRLWTRKNVWLSRLYSKYYNSERKELNSWNVKRIDAEGLAHIWMGDGYLEHSKNRKKDKVQNIGWLCFEAYPKEELELLQKHLLDTWGIGSSLVSKPWGFGYRLRIGGENLQILISTIYPYILDSFKYKTLLFYKGKDNVCDLPNAGQYIYSYKCVEDIVRHPLKKGKT